MYYLVHGFMVMHIQHSVPACCQLQWWQPLIPATMEAIPAMTPMVAAIPAKGWQQYHQLAYQR